jgi:hypothetical protein
MNFKFHCHKSFNISLELQQTTSKSFNKQPARASTNNQQELQQTTSKSFNKQPARTSTNNQQELQHQLRYNGRENRPGNNIVISENTWRILPPLAVLESNGCAIKRIWLESLVMRDIREGRKPGWGL